jgi:SAM-dependent methyltransferase
MANNRNKDRAESADQCLTGEFLYGDDFTPEDAERWFQQEMDVCYEIRKTYPPGYTYQYHALHWEHGYRHLPKKTFGNVLGYGAALGEELDGIRDRCKSITIVDPADGYRNDRARYIKPLPDGTLPFPTNSFDLITCFGVLHHICKVKVVFNELARCLQPGGHLLVYEPVTSLGDWRKARGGLSSNERGIPLPIFLRMIAESGLEIIRQTRCEFRPLFIAALPFGHQPFNSRLLTKVDAVICKFVPYRYHATTWLQKLRFVGAYFVLRKP